MVNMRCNYSVSGRSTIAYESCVEFKRKTTQRGAKNHEKEFVSSNRNKNKLISVVAAPTANRIVGVFHASKSRSEKIKTLAAAAMSTALPRFINMKGF